VGCKRFAPAQKVVQGMEQQRRETGRAAWLPEPASKRNLPPGQLVNKWGLLSLLKAVGNGHRRYDELLIGLSLFLLSLNSFTVWFIHRLPMKWDNKPQHCTLGAEGASPLLVCCKGISDTTHQEKTKKISAPGSIPRPWNSIPQVDKLLQLSPARFWPRPTSTPPSRRASEIRTAQGPFSHRQFRCRHPILQTIEVL